jgi:predicted membrane channel-forming protein YqfA (hemolysin III family)
MSIITARSAKARYPDFSYAQEAGNAISHALGVALAVAGLVLLVVTAVTRGNVWHVVSYVALVAAFTDSNAYLRIYSVRFYQ